MTVLETSDASANVVSALLNLNDAEIVRFGAAVDVMTSDARSVESAGTSSARQTSTLCWSLSDDRNI